MYNIPIQAVLDKIEELESRENINNLRKYVPGTPIIPVDNLTDLKSWLHKQVEGEDKLFEHYQYDIGDAKNEFAHRQLRNKAGQVNDI